MISKISLKYSFLFILATLCFSSVLAQTKERLPCVDKKFSVVAHIFRDTLGAENISESQILQIFDGVNIDFAPICVSFEVCEFIYHDNFQYDNHEQDLDWAEMQTLYHVNNRLNIYYVKTIFQPVGACGYAGLGQIQDPFSSGIVIMKSGSCCGITSKTHSHELGHYFGLSHTFMETGTDELVDGSNCSTAGDRICDTPADPFINGTPVGSWVNGNCRFISNAKDANGAYYDPIVGNIMSYYPDNCACGFTDDQFRKMAQTYLNGSKHW